MSRPGTSGARAPGTSVDGACDLGEREGVTGVACGTGVVYGSGMGVTRQPSLNQDHTRRSHFSRTPARARPNGGGRRRVRGHGGGTYGA